MDQVHDIVNGGPSLTESKIQYTIDISEKRAPYIFYDELIMK